MNERNQSTFRIEPFLILFAVVLFSSFCLQSVNETLRSYQFLMSLVMLLVIIFCFRKIIHFDAVIFTMISGIFLRFCYTLYTAVWTRQHDVVDFNVGEGQAAYIEYFLTHKSLPDFDPRSIWGFFQPPLHHIVSAIWMKISLFMGLTERQAQENVQALTFFYMSALVILTYYICKELELRARGTLITMAIVSLHPIYVLLSGSINNDALSLLLMGLAMYLAIVWYKRPSVWRILLLGLSIGLAMIAKLSGGMIAPAVAALFILKLIKQKGSRVKYILQYVAFGIVCVPIGLSFTIRNMVKFSMPINYIPPVGGQFDYSMLARLLDFRMDSVFPAMTELGNNYYEHNVFLALMKTSLFGEYNYGNDCSFFYPVCTILFIAALVLAVAALVATALLLFSQKSTLKTEWKWFLGVLYTTLMISYLSFALSYSNFSAQDFRYGALAIIVEAIFLGIYADNLSKENRKDKLLLGIIIGATALFGICSFITYLGLGFVS